MIYAGIGSTVTPEYVIKRMRGIGAALASMSFILRSGKALGADSAFEVGAMIQKGRKELFGAYAGARNPAWHTHAQMFHPAWDKCDIKARAMHARNSAIMLGASLTEPVDFVVCWTANGEVKGGTGQGLRIAAAYGIPIYNLGIDGEERRMWCMIEGFYRGNG